MCLLLHKITFIFTILAIIQAPPDADQIASVSWDFQDLATSAYTEEFVITEPITTLKLNKIKQKTDSMWKKAIVEYLMKLEDESVVDTGIYKVFQGSIGKFEVNLYGSITPRTYKIKITNLNGEDLLIRSRRIMKDLDVTKD
ncbi:hypothetical protein [Psychrobacillus vulpis]|uniref:Uncharacterized protein n=1 Tax=Psychrobacillus vulpis TaxID=2325572 RepID=A0A544TWC5_9BACI|nr:hypothetical protein [Psychrobacillus vulpis]TQR21750.1 hypothetical protein FG384_02005 [Psychrobacillus vulpis]